MAGELDSFLSKLSLYGEGLSLEGGGELLPQYAWQKTISPSLYAELGRNLTGMSQRKADAVMSSTIEGLASSERESNRRFMDQQADMGMDRTSALRVRDEIGPRWEETAATVRGQVEAGQIGEEMDILGATTDAIARSTDYQRMLDLEEYNAVKSRETIRRGRKRAFQAQMVGAVGSLALGGFGMAGLAGLGPLSGLATAGVAGGGGLGALGAVGALGSMGSMFGSFGGGSGGAGYAPTYGTGARQTSYAPSGTYGSYYG